MVTEFLIIFRYNHESMLFVSHPLHEISQEILCNQSYANMGGNSYIECWETHPQMTKSFVFNCLPHRIEDVFVGETSIR